MKKVLKNIATDLKKCFSGCNLVLQLLAVIATFLLVISGADWKYLKFSILSGTNNYFYPAVIIGGIIPVLAPPLLIIYGKIKNNLTFTILGLTEFEAVLVTYLLTTLYKLLTGRAGPNGKFSISIINTSQHFRLGFFKGGIMGGWPSSHTAIAFVMAIILIYFFPKNQIIFFSALAYALLIGIGVSANVHWLSDCVAGAIIGSVVGRAIGKRIKHEINLYSNLI